MATPSSSMTRLRPFVALISVLLVIAAIYVAHAVVVPVVLAALLAFLLSPAVSFLQRWHVPRTAASILTSLLAFAFLGGVLTVVAFQFQDLAKELPKHRDEILAKAESIHKSVDGDWLKDLTDVFDEAVKTISPPAVTDKTPPPTEPPAPTPAAMPAAMPRLWAFQTMFSPAIEFLLEAGVVMVLVVFMLAQHEDLRNRLIRLSGTGNVTSTTKAFGDAARRVRRFLFMQLLVNTSFGLIVSLGLWVIGVPFPWLWGILGALLRYVPYIGTWLAAACPVLMAAALPGWLPALETFGLFVLLDIVITNILEPIVYGRSIGVSGTALLIAAVFWTWLWGPIGLIMSTPLTACLVVLGRHVSHLEFLGVLLGDAPVLSLPLRFYQRLLARDEDEASHVVEEYIKKEGVEKVYDGLFLPALAHAKENLARGVLTAEDETFLLTTIHQLLEDVVFPEQDALPGSDVAPPPEADGDDRPLVLACPAKDQMDEAPLEMLRRLIPASKCRIELMTTEPMAGEVLARVGELRPAVVCIGAVPPFSFAAVRYLCKRLRRQFPTVKILVGCWGLRDDVKETTDRLQKAGADLASAELLETRTLLLPLLQELTLARKVEQRTRPELEHA